MKNIPILAILLSLAAGTVYAEAYKSILPLDASTYNKIPHFYSFVDWGASGWLSKSSPFPDAKVYSLAHKKFVSVKSLVKNRPIVLEMGSITCPAYDLNIAKIKELQKQYKGQIDFYTLYVRENHPSDMYRAHAAFSQKTKYAAELAQKDHIDHEILVDDVKGSLHQALGNFGNSVYLIGTDMHVNHWSPFANAQLLQQGITALLKAGGVAAKADFIGGVDVHPLASQQYSQEEKIETLGKMKSRIGSPAATKEQASQAQKDIAPALQKLQTSLDTGLQQYLKNLEANPPKAASPQESQEKLATTLKSIFEMLRPDLKKRYEDWKKANHIDSKENIAADVLKSQA